MDFAEDTNFGNEIEVESAKTYFVNETVGGVNWVK